MMQRPFGFVLMAGLLLAALVLCAKGLSPQPEVQPAEAIAAEPMPSSTVVQTPTPDALATSDATGMQTSEAAHSSMTDTQSANSTMTAIAETQTPMAWTQSAVDIQSTIDKAGADEAEAKAFMAWQTVTMLPTALTETEAAKWATVAAEQTAVIEREQAQGRSKFWGGLASEVWGALQVAVPALMILFLIVVAFLGANAFIKNLEAPTWVRKAQALSISSASTIPGRVGSKPRELVRDADRAALIEFVRTCRAKSGDGSTTITPQSQFGSDAGWSEAVKALTYHGLVTTKPGNGGGTRIADGLTLAELEQVLRQGNEAEEPR